ncbi:tyrosine-protein phosphatase [Gracilibacillus dipsosauri]|uniref:tyrosine-protein phosphatase n=1 Tax=Gracilibacillus dipsosauri TaxID=178340 RepID=UPI002408F3ED
MIDIHSHILPELDDGPNTLASSIAMAQRALKEGIHTIIATPHHLDGHFINQGKKIEQAVEQLNDLLQEENVPLKVLTGQESRINGDMIERLRREEIIPLNNSKYVYVELPSNHIPNYTSQVLFDMQVLGYKPIIVHPERNISLTENPDQLYRLVKNGALTQITAASLVGKLGKKIQRFSIDLIDHNLTHFIASDAHNTNSRGFHLDEAYHYMNKVFGSSMVFQFKENVEKVVENQSVIGDQPIRIKQRKLFGMIKR